MNLKTFKIGSLDLLTLDVCNHCILLSLLHVASKLLMITQRLITVVHILIVQ